jgi:hypothetical protein
MVEHATQVTYDASQSSAQLFSDPSLGKPYRAFMVGLADRKQGLLPRMQMAAREVDQLTRTGGPVQGAKARVKREADALRTEATSLGEAADALGAFLGKISCN